MVKHLIYRFGFLGLVGLLVASTGPKSATAATPSLRTSFVQTLETKRNAYRNDGVFTGGRAGTGTSLLAVRRAYSKSAAVERVIVDLGDKDAKPAGAAMGFFQASLDGVANRVTLDVSQLRLSKVTETQLQRVFKNSAYVKHVALTLDPEDHAATMVLDLKRPVRLEVYRTVKAGQPAMVVMDLVPRTTRR